MAQVRPYPMDFDALRKGDVIAVDEIESITGFKRGDGDRYQIALLGLCDRIYKEMAARNKPVTLSTKGGAIRVLTDPEALMENERRQRIKRDGLLRDHRRTVHIDRANLSEAQRRQHTFLILAGANILSGMKQGLKLARNGLVYNQVMPTKLKDIRERQQEIEDKRSESA